MGALGEPEGVTTYSYGDSSWGDLLTGYYDRTITYDTIGNPLSDGIWTYTWQNGRELASMTGNGVTWSYTYDANGMRTSRTNGTDTYHYIYNGGQLVQMQKNNTDTLYFDHATGTVTWNGVTYYYVYNLQGDVIAILDGNGTCVVEYIYDAWGYLVYTYGSKSGSLGVLNPLTYRAYTYDHETGLYYLQSRYYNPEVGRFLNADAYASTGQGILGHNMFAYCNNNAVLYYDPTGYAMHWAHASTCLAGDGGSPIDYVIYYFHDESSKNLNGPAYQNHSAYESQFIGVSSFDELVEAINNPPKYVDDIFMYLHSDQNNLSFYCALYYSTDSIEENFNKVDIYGDIYLFACQGGRGKLASTIAHKTECTVIASLYKVSFGDGYTRCGWKNYLRDVWDHGLYSWYSFNPDGSKAPYSPWFIYTR